MRSRLQSHTAPRPTSSTRWEVTLWITSSSASHPRRSRTGTCVLISDCNNPVHLVQRAARGVSGADAGKQTKQAAYATEPSNDSTHSAPGAQTVDQISAILRDQFGILPKRRAIGYTKPYPSDYDLIPLPPKYWLLEFTKFGGAEGSSSIEHVSRYLAQLGMISVSDPCE
jgi:hypothetical protein